MDTRTHGYRNTKAHPVYQLIQHAGIEGRPPSAAELDALRLAPRHRSRVLRAATEVARFNQDGENQEARRHADNEADEIVNNLLPDEQADADYLRPPDPPGPGDPASLADAVARR